MKKELLVENARVVTPGADMRKAAILVRNGKIAAVFAKGEPRPRIADTYDAKGALAVPGFIDVHLHGACGCDVCDGDDPRAIETIAKAKLQEGCTSFLPTTLTVARQDILKAARNVARYRKNMKYAKALGIHLEGPFINPACCGAQNPAHVRKPDIREVAAVDKIAPVKMITFAPEQEGGAEFAAECIKRGIVPSCGHTGATLAQFMPAYKAGLRHLTHFCNQMTKLHHREIGIVGAGFLIDDLNTEIICDKIHLCPDMLRLVFKNRPIEHIQIITDSLRCSHLPDGYAFEMGGLKVMLKGGEARLVEGGNLAGSTLWINKGLKNIIDETGIPLKDAVRISSWNQAIELGMGKTLGRIAKGYAADIAILDPKTFDVKAVFVDGERRECD